MATPEPQMAILAWHTALQRWQAELARLHTMEHDLDPKSAYAGQRQRVASTYQVALDCYSAAFPAGKPASVRERED